MPEQTSAAYDRLVAALAENFTDTELHGLMIAAGLRDRGMAHWLLLRRAAIDATDCTECDIRTGL